MVTDPVLGLLDMSKPFVVETDASDFVLGGVLMQDGHPVAFESKKLKDIERCYSVHEKELLDICSPLAQLPPCKGSGKRVTTERSSSAGPVHLVGQGKARQFWLEDGLLMTKGNHLYVPKSEDLRKSVILECHDTLWAGHPGEDRTYALVQRAYYWPQMWDDAETYVRNCFICQQDKADHQKKAGLLQPLPIPKGPWKSVSMQRHISL
ncbi:hypothetical protein Sango_1247100 [Sesamum angolense]|uniref:Integrase zinc-binding domain-containing protein n=1 Tax=Sesamum angolense TaxID=2727404 RepID=A0AAE2BU09_9LAMI|nr:hypothetical protein Sango_1247100 [Sesamum angolense]